MNYPPPVYMPNIELEDRKEAAEKNTPGVGYHDWEAGAPHDSNHTTVPPPVAAAPQRRRVDLSLWHVIFLYDSVVFLGTTVIALIVVMANHLNCAAQSSLAEIPLTVNASTTTTVSVAPLESLQSTRDITTTAITTSTTTTVTSSSSQPTKVPISTVTPTAPTVWVTEVVASTSNV